MNSNLQNELLAKGSLTIATKSGMIYTNMDDYALHTLVNETQCGGDTSIVDIVGSVPKY